MRTVERHEIDQNFAAEQVKTLGRGIEKYLSRVEQRPGLLTGVFDTAQLVMSYACAQDPTARYGVTWKSTTVAMQAGSALFATAGTRGIVECKIDVDIFRIPAVEPYHGTDPSSWLRTFWLAAICREKARLDMLSNIPESVLRASEAQIPEYIYSWVQAFQLFWRRDDSYFARLNDAIRATDPEVLPEETHEGILLTMYPPMKVFSYLVQRDAEKFNDALAESLELHRTYWTRNADRAKDSHGYIALAPTALASIAFDMDIPVEVESPYMPKHLVDRTWIGEFPT
jgi:hypothetical protein